LEENVNVSGVSKYHDFFVKGQKNFKNEFWDTPTTNYYGFARRYVIKGI
jgi:NADH:ubiquinone oxidoreductase subunit